MDALEIIRAVTSDIGLPRPDAAYASTDTLVRQLVGMLNKEGRDLSRRGPWQALVEEVTFVTLATESQGTLGSIAARMRYPINETFWNRTTQQPIEGPISPVDWQQLKAQANVSPYTQYRFRGNELLMTPAPTAGHTCAFEMVRKTWCTDVTGAAFRSAVGADTDLMLLDDELMILGIRMRWRAAKGFDTTQDSKDYEREVQDALARDGSKRKLSLSAGDSGNTVKTAIPRRIGI